MDQAGFAMGRHPRPRPTLPDPRPPSHSLEQGKVACAGPFRPQTGIHTIFFFFFFVEVTVLKIKIIVLGPKKDPRKTTPRHILIKMAKIKDKGRLLKAAREK